MYIFKIIKDVNNVFGLNFSFKDTLGKFSYRPCIGPFTLAKTKICPIYTARKTHNFSGFWQEKRMREKTQNLTVFLVRGAYVRLLSTFHRTECTVRRVRPAAGAAGDPRSEGHVPRDQEPK